MAALSDDKDQRNGKKSLKNVDTSLLEMEPPSIVCGDIHRQYSDLLRILDKNGFPPDVNFLFLGERIFIRKEDVLSMYIRNFGKPPAALETSIIRLITNQTLRYHILGFITTVFCSDPEKNPWNSSTTGLKFSSPFPENHDMLHSLLISGCSIHP
ncbi:hypothetical protein CRE_08395 [Caenorhabditis remanei]|uniref:Calcineurin-like phosphoesterase domain-containing protein n=1 Tax=Caenorhabditis remanei TaxID=31234 RepID=E3MPI1_CAERE|nr:hypothetical protein CRE_08395 [Caenorhabditis remanei]